MFIKYTIHVMILCVAFSTSSNADQKYWHFEWHKDEMSDQLSCFMASNEKYFSTRIGNHTVSDYIYLAIQDSGSVSIISRSIPFNPLVKSKIGVRVDRNPPVMGVDMNSQSRIVTFDKERSIELIEQMRKGEEILVQVALFPYADEMRNTFILQSNNPLSYFTLSLAAWKGCQYNKQTDGWAGLLLLKSECLDACQKQLEEKYKGRADSLTSVWSAKPTHPAAKAGLKEGDSIFGINGEVKPYEDIFDAIKNLSRGNSLLLNVYSLETDRFKEITLSR